MTRRFWLATIVSAAVLIGLVPAAAAATPPLPASMAAIGDSITQAASTGGSLGADYPQNSWSTGTNTTVNSHYLRLLALNSAISERNYNRSVSGAKMADLNAQMQNVVALKPDYLTVLIGGNDVCTDTVGAMTEVTPFRSQFETAMATLKTGSPNTNVYVSSIPNVYHLWELFKGNFWARFIWSAGNICQSLLANPTSTTQTDVARRSTVAQRNVDFNTQLAEVCAKYLNCRWDGNAAYNTVFTTSDASGDYFHPSISGQAKLAAVSWGAGFWPNGAPPPNQPPTASFTYSCVQLVCSFDSTSSDADGTIVSYAWTFGQGDPATVEHASHTYTAAGTYEVTLQVTDNAGATGSVTQQVSVSAAAAGTASIAALTSSATARKGGWTATVTIRVVDNLKALVPGATVTGSWLTGASSTCITGPSGTCSVSLKLGKWATNVTWTVSGITHATLTYAPGGNAVSSIPIQSPLPSGI